MMFERIRKYFLLLVSFFRASAIADLEYRLNITVKIITDIFWYAAQLSVFEVLFKHTNNLSGWTLDSTRVFMGLLFVVDACWMLFFSENLDRFSEKVRKGDLDLLLVKPVNSQFMMSFQRVNTPYIGNILIAASWLVYALHRMPGDVSWNRLGLLVITIPCSLAITYSLRFLFSVQALIFTRADNINYVWYQLYRLGTRPDALYPPWLRYAILTVLPVGFLASVPARLILNKPDLFLLGASVGIAVIAVYLSTRFWRFALRFYSSASS
jgi:ABC-2 type transport system permease protein